MDKLIPRVLIARALVLLLRSQMLIINILGDMKKLPVHQVDERHDIWECYKNLATEIESPRKVKKVA